MSTFSAAKKVWYRLMTTQAKQQPTDKVLVFVAIVGIVCTIIISVTANRAINHYQQQSIGQGGGYEPPPCLCATPTETPVSTVKLSPCRKAMVRLMKRWPSKS